MSIYHTTRVTVILCNALLTLYYVIRKCPYAKEVHDEHSDIINFASAAPNQLVYVRLGQVVGDLAGPYKIVKARK